MATSDAEQPSAQTLLPVHRLPKLGGDEYYTVYLPGRKAYRIVHYKDNVRRYIASNASDGDEVMREVPAPTERYGVAQVAARARHRYAEKRA